MALVGTSPQPTRLIDRLRAASAVSRQEAAERLAGLGDRGREAIPALIEAAADSSASVQMAVIGALGTVGAEDERAVGAVASALSDPEQAVRGAALDALEEVGPRAKTAIPAVIDRLEHLDWGETTRLIGLLDTLGGIDQAAVRAGPRLLGLLEQMPAGLKDYYPATRHCRP